MAEIAGNTSFKTLGQSKSNFDRKLKDAQRLSRSFQDAIKALRDSFRTYQSTVAQIKKQTDNTLLIQEIEQSLNQAQDSYHQTKQELARLLKVLLVHDKNLPNKKKEKDRDSASDSDEIEEDQEKKSSNKPQESKLRKNVKRVLFGVLAIILVYFIFFLVISNTVKNRRLQAIKGLTCYLFIKIASTLCCRFHWHWW